MFNDRLSNKPADTTPDSPPGDAFDRPISVETSALDAIHENVINPRARYIDAAAQIIEEAIINDPQPNPDNFSNIEEYIVAAEEWDARMSRALHEAAELRGRMLELEEVQAELRLAKTYIKENKAE